MEAWMALVARAVDAVGVFVIIAGMVIATWRFARGEARASDADPGALDSLPGGTALLVVRRGPNAGSRFLLDSDITTAGRHRDSDIFLDDVTVSRRHAEFYRHGDRFTVRDVGSLNGTYVSNRRISKAVLKDGDEILIGKHTVQFKDEWHEDAPAEKTQAQKPMPVVPKLEATMVLDTKKAKEMMEKLAAATAAKAPAPTPAPPPSSTTPRSTT